MFFTLYTKGVGWDWKLKVVAIIICGKGLNTMDFGAKVR